MADELSSSLSTERKNKNYTVNNKILLSLGISSVPSKADAVDVEVL
jgi:hypothetical protein